MATENECRLYGHGLCHVHAMAAVRLHGGGFLIVTDPEEVFWSHPEDADLDQIAVIHVYSVHDTPAGPVARDIFGDRPLEAAAEEARERYDCFVVDTDLTSDLDDLMDLVDVEGTEEKPLLAITDEQITEALELDSVMAPVAHPAPMIDVDPAPF